MGEYIGIYRRAHYYDIVFRRDVTGEVQFLIELYQRSTARPIRSNYRYRLRASLPCQGICSVVISIKAVALDLQPEMIEFARSLDPDETGDIHYLASDMRDYALPAPVDLALNSFDSIDCLATQEQIVDHFRAVARNLTPNGLYVIEITHPRDCSMWNYGNFKYVGERDGVSVVIDWAVNKPKADPLTQVIECEVVMTVVDNGKSMTFRETARERFSTLQELCALAKLSGAMSFHDAYGDFRFDQPFDNSPTARRMIVVLKANHGA